MNTEQIMPLFPLGVVLLPDMLLTLHIFEERYKEMIGRCLDTNSDFGIVYFVDGQIRRAGCSSQILKVTHRYENGEMDIITIGKQRFLIKEVYDTKAYLEATVIYFDDEPEAESEDLSRLANEGINSLEEMNRRLGIKSDKNEKAHLNSKEMSFLISRNEGFTLSEKQKLLEMTSTKKRLKDSVRALQKVIQRARLTREIEGIIRGNGDLKKLLDKYGI